MDIEFEQLKNEFYFKNGKLVSDIGKSSEFVVTYREWTYETDSLIIIWCIYLSAGFFRDLGTNKPDIHTPYQAKNLIS